MTRFPIAKCMGSSSTGNLFPIHVSDSSFQDWDGCEHWEEVDGCGSSPQTIGFEKWRRVSGTSHVTCVSISRSLNSTSLGNRV